MFFEGSKDFEIDIYNLTNGDHHFDLKYDDKLFAISELSLIEKGKGAIEIDLTKSYSMLVLKINISGFITLTCDRSLEDFDYEFESSQEVILKFGEEYEEQDISLFIIPHNILRINIEQLVYEIISSSVPMKKIHPSFDEEESLNFVDEVEEEEELDDQTEVDPRWSALKNLKENKN